MTPVMNSPGASVVSTSGVVPGSRCSSAMGMRRDVPSALAVSTVASSTRMATAMSLGWVAMHALLAPTIACWRLMPSSALQPLPGCRLLHG